MPLVEYVGFILYMNNNQDVVKLQRLQNRALQMCFDINIPIDVRTIELHNMARVDTLQKHRELSLLCMMYDLKQLGMYDRIRDPITRQCDKYIFRSDIANVGIYMRSLYYVGARSWNKLPANIQHARRKARFKYEVSLFFLPKLRH